MLPLLVRSLLALSTLLQPPDLPNLRGLGGGFLRQLARVHLLPRSCGLLALLPHQCLDTVAGDRPRGSVIEDSERHDGHGGRWGRGGYGCQYASMR